MAGVISVMMLVDVSPITMKKLFRRVDLQFGIRATGADAMHERTIMRSVSLSVIRSRPRLGCTHFDVDACARSEWVGEIEIFRKSYGCYINCGCVNLVIHEYDD